MKKRMITICVLAAMLLSCASCGSTETGNDETTKSGGTDTTVGDTTAEPTEYDKYPLPEKDMDGFNLRFCNYDDSWLCLHLQMQQLLLSPHVKVLFA